MSYPPCISPDLPKWINEFRSNGFVALLGYQNFAQLQHIYGRDLSRALFAACGTKVFFNPKDRETAHEFSGYLGEKEVRLFTHSRSQGRYGGQSRSEQVQRVPLMTADQILKLKQGECVFINPALPGAGRGFSPAEGASAAFQTRTLGAGPQYRAVAQHRQRQADPALSAANPSNRSG